MQPRDVGRRLSRANPVAHAAFDQHRSEDKRHSANCIGQISRGGKRSGWQFNTALRSSRAASAQLRNERHEQVQSAMGQSLIPPPYTNDHVNAQAGPVKYFANFITAAPATGLPANSHDTGEIQPLRGIPVSLAMAQPGQLGLSERIALHAATRTSGSLSRSNCAKYG